MEQPTTFYSTQLENHQNHLKQFNKKLVVLSSLRLTVFLVAAIGIYFTFSTWHIALAIGVIGTILFVFLLSKYTDLKRQRGLTKALININEAELQMLSGNYDNQPTGEKFLDPHHAYSLDIDLFGKGSFFQTINRTKTKEGKQYLAKTLTANNIENITKRQEAIKELTKLPEWRQNFSALASLIHVETPNKDIINWLQQYKPFANQLLKYLPLGFSMASLALLALTIFQLIPMSISGYWLLLGLMITGRHLKNINILAAHTDKVKDTFRQYAQLLQQIEAQTFQSKLLTEKQEQIQSHHKKASDIFGQLSGYLDALDNRNNLISAIFGNGLFLTDLKHSYHIEQWIATYKDVTKEWFDVVSFFEAYNSLANYAFNQPDFVYPKIVQDQSLIHATGLGHPLLDANKRITSDLIIDNQQFFIVTGANMAGKSTFLRTVSLHIMMANVGLPVCAQESSYHPIKLITSMRTTDSLTDDSSYFFSELTRLKYIVDAIQDQPYFIILDEILKGTNSTDKAIGSRKFVEKLVATHATGIIATHDLSLCEIEKELPPVANYYFDAQIVNDELFFDYKLKKGICQNMNASFLLQKMGIV
ncbi:DNA mismatch repair protein MutS [Mangrovimonas sp. YM274]|uniref:MutS-related protein n=1 Tax=Mangrovimonas sp. YM274 TaxID=3070660 RepID=UPI0027DB9F0B|nr:DNA mismatch repair protein MutS [Mangrovimonas sp. YM274]WMI68799.1 DNA mismatch repair protein MutS [Mangrovimonas sp. YM274]